MDIKNLDNLTPTFQFKMRLLSLQQQKIVDLLSGFDGLAVKEIAQRCFITEQTASSQLYKLKQEGIVFSVPNGRESMYQLQDIQLRDWLRMRGKHCKK